MTSNFDISTWGALPPSLYPKRNTAPAQPITRSPQPPQSQRPNTYDSPPPKQPATPSSKELESPLTRAQKTSPKLGPRAPTVSSPASPSPSPGTGRRHRSSASSPSSEAERGFIRNMRYRDLDRPHAAAVFADPRKRRRDGSFWVPEGYTDGWRPMVGGAACPQGWMAELEREKPPEGVTEEEWWEWI